MILNSKKLRKLRTNPKLFFKDAIEKKLLHLNSTYNKYLPKKHKGFTQYTIISAVYNVEKYLDDYFKSIINQRLDFKKNIFMILVDDGSTDNSAQIIKKYQKKYPKNIVYLYKENGGQASARNLGLKYMQENDYQIPWVTFTDPDDFLDRNYFYEVDKFLATHKANDICMIGCNIIFYYEKQKIHKDNHPLNFKFKSGVQVKENYNLDSFIQLSAASCFMNIGYLDKLLFDEKLKPNFEDAKFINEYLLDNINLKSAFLPTVKYFYRKREDGNSTLDNSNKYSDLYLLVSCRGCLKLLQENKFYDIFIQNVCLYHFFWQIKTLVNSPEKLSFMSESEKQRYLELLDQNFSYIDKNTIMEFNLAGCWFFHKIGILNCFKNEKPPFQIAYIEDYDPYKEQILLTYYTGDDENIESIFVDGEEVYADYKKIVKYDFLDRVFCYQKRLWAHIPKNAKDKLENFIDGEQSKISFNGKHYQSINIKDIRQEFQKRLPKSNIWLFADRDYEADDNAEHLYRYIMQNHPEQKIVFALRKESLDWERLEKEGFNLVEFGSLEFERIIKKASKVISSHSDEYLIRYITPRQQFIFLQHGVIKDDLSKWLNSKKIDLFITSTKAEYDSIANDYNHYKFGKKEVVLTGLARHDALLKNNQCNARQIIIMPTWRANIVGVALGSSKRGLQSDFTQSEYFKKWNLLLNSNILQKLCEKYDYTIVFNPHPNIIPYLKDFNIPSYVKIANHNESLQELFCNSSLMITDYSSVAFEMAYLNKPVIYYQFDHEEFFNSHTYQKGYFDYKKDGFGPVVEDEESLLKELENLLQNDCNPFGIYKDNIDSTFAFKDGKCCERIYKVIKYDK
ncbi:bifunctional glycosyltransferase family 2 protein/CDP-glycerol:glycerophosphate glycerophosphotransferase [Campylobacter coli]|uniref:CDP-glycerol glycerophosphotransferase family protein n=1 Tax=Campylobacter coli TaxID=195 RepID=UPI001F090A51|nr:CDP-glycerol glycerophosphotransferase family protein [Campylobacter coli]MCH3699607.1 bifunctional glycosyltransferase family 2 protein/CDP-glycerol:glycerophosphate glycerophosphotransferase [Campylobacter coli]MCH3704700.1 bifunctional glycosyltransferase family 2 protein/CDP-glycerol:glycerophosphate glycerophosphotransferase [Campylobacter coli]MCH3716452.1 bifunctional glycosyltransferase family 2 protein/CDP-glycerol:glycerophosphate glycerophosphotransferase [Campylobacter coli]HEE96